MTVAALTPSVSYVENGVTTNFSVPFRYLDPTHLSVKRTAADGTQTTLVYGAQWTATAGATDTGGTLTLLAAANGSTLTIQRRTPRSQTTDYVANDRFPAEAHEGTVDRAMLIDQEQDVDLSRALLVPIGEGGFMLPPAGTRALGYLGFDSFGNPIAVPATSNPALFNPFETMDGAAAAVLPGARKFLHVGARTAASERVMMAFRRVAAQPPHSASFRSQDRFLPDGSSDPANGGWWELASPRVTPEMLADRPCGYQVGTNGYAAAPDDTAILNAAIAAAIHLDVPLELHGKWYRHNSGLVAKPTRAAPYQGTTNTTRDIAFWNVLNAQGFEIKGFGNAGLIAGGAMSYQLRVYNDFAIANSIESNWIKVEGIKFNGNALASVSNLYLNWSGNADVVRCGMAGAARAVQVFGYGVFNIYHNDMRASYITVDVQAGGDAVIQDNDIFVEGVGVNAAGNIRVARNTFTGTGFATSGNANRIGITINPVGTNAAGTFPYTYGMRIENNEFNAIDMAVYGNATSSAFHAIHMVSIVNNHVIADQNVMPDVGLCDLTYARTVFIAGNQIGRDVQVVSQNVAIRLTDCEMVHLSNVDFVNIGNSAAVLTRCKNVNGHDCSFTNVSCVVNAMAYSEALQTAPWAQTNLTVVTATTSAVAAGTLLARNGATLQRLQDNTTNGLHGNTQPRTVVSGQPYTITALVKAAELTKCKLVPYASGVGVSFDLSGGTVITKDAGCDGGIDSLGGGVYRIWASLNSAPGTTANPGIYLMNAAGATSYAGTSQGLFAAGLGMVTGYAPPSYIGATGASGSAQPAQIVLTDSDHCNFHDNTVLAKYNHVLPTVHVAETGTSNNNIVKDTVLSDPATITPFFRSGAQSYAVHWEKSAFRVSKTATQSVPTSTSTKITFDSLNLNRGGKFASDKYTPGIGPVDLAGSLRVSGLVVGTAFEVTVTKNGTAIGGSGRLAAATDDTISFAVCDEAAVGDYYEVYLYAAGAGSKTVSNDGRFTYFSGRLG